MSSKKKEKTVQKGIEKRKDRGGRDERKRGGEFNEIHIESSTMRER